MSDEEKKAIDSLKVISEYAGDNYLAKEHRRKLKLLIELVEKQQEEIEKLKIIADKFEDLKNLYDDQISEIEELEKEIEALKLIHESYKEMIEENNYVSKDKIKPKIEEGSKKSNEI